MGLFPHQLGVARPRREPAHLLPAHVDGLQGQPPDRRRAFEIGRQEERLQFGTGAAYAWQHDVTQQPDRRVTVFDNGTGVYVTQPESRGLVLEVDDVAGSVDLVHAYSHPGNALRSGALGSVQVLPDGHIFVGWGTHAWYTEFEPDGTAVLDGNLAGSATQSYRAFRSPWTGQPAEPPGVAAKLTSEGMTVFAAWNGATEVSRWAVLGGSDRSRLRTITVVPKNGFETAIPLRARPLCSRRCARRRRPSAGVSATIVP